MHYKLRKRLLTAATVGLFGLAGVAALIVSQAATFNVAVEAENGQLSGPAQKLDGGAAAGASKSSAIRFTVAVTPPPTTPPPTTPPPTVPPHSFKFMAVGDSITQGTNGVAAYRDNVWRKLRADGYTMQFVGSTDFGGGDDGFRSIFEAYPGRRIDDLTSLAASAVTTYQPDVVLILAGTNDVAQKYSGAVINQRMEAFMNMVYSRAPKARIVVSSVPPLVYSDANFPNACNWTCPQLTDFNNSVPALVAKFKAQGKKAYFADLSGAGLIPSTVDFPDKVHPSEAAYEKMANTYYPVIKPFFTEPL